jgi:hypothetical protein
MASISTHDARRCDHRPKIPVSPDVKPGHSHHGEEGIPVKAPVRLYANPEKY